MKKVIQNNSGQEIANSFLTQYSVMFFHNNIHPMKGRAHQKISILTVIPLYVQRDDYKV